LGDFLRLLGGLIARRAEQIGAAQDERPHDQHNEGDSPNSQSLAVQPSTLHEIRSW